MENVDSPLSALVCVCVCVCVCVREREREKGGVVSFFFKIGQITKLENCSISSWLQATRCFSALFFVVMCQKVGNIEKEITAQNNNKRNL